MQSNAWNAIIIYRVMFCALCSLNSSTIINSVDEKSTGCITCLMVNMTFSLCCIQVFILLCIIASLLSFYIALIDLPKWGISTIFFINIINYMHFQSPVWHLRSMDNCRKQVKQTLLNISSRDYECNILNLLLTELIRVTLQWYKSTYLVLTPINQSINCASKSPFIC